MARYKKGETPLSEFENIFDRFLKKIPQTRLSDFTNLEDFTEHLKSMAYYNKKLDSRLTRLGLKRDFMDSQIQNLWTNFLNQKNYRQLFKFIYNENQVDKVVESSRKILSTKGFDKTSLKNTKQLVKQNYISTNTGIYNFNRKITRTTREKNRMVRGWWGEKQLIPKILVNLSTRGVQSRRQLDDYLRNNNLGTERELTPLSQEGLIKNAGKRGLWTISRRGMNLLQEYSNVR